MSIIATWTMKTDYVSGPNSEIVSLVDHSASHDNMIGEAEDYYDAHDGQCIFLEYGPNGEHGFKEVREVVTFGELKKYDVTVENIEGGHRLSSCKHDVYTTDMKSRHVWHTGDGPCTCFGFCKCNNTTLKAACTCTGTGPMCKIVVYTGPLKQNDNIYLV